MYNKQACISSAPMLTVRVCASHMFEINTENGLSKTVANMLFGITETKLLTMLSEYSGAVFQALI